MTTCRWFLVALSACAGFGQTTDTGSLDRTFQLSSADPKLRAEIVAAVSSLTGIAPGGDEARGTFTVRGTSADLALAEWIFKELDAASLGSPAEFRVPGGADDVLHSYRLSRLTSPKGMQELMNALRSLVEVRRIYLCEGAQRILLRGTVADSVLAGWMVNELDRNPVSGAAQYLAPGGPVPVVRAFRLANTRTPQELQELVNAIRSIAELQRVVPVNEASAIMARGDAAQADLAEWLVKELDLPKGGPEPADAEFSTSIPPASSVRVCFLGGSATLQEVVNQIRSRAHMQRVVGFSSRRAIVMRASPAQTAQGAAIAAEMGKAGAR
jgi:hypothetical protein